MGRKLVWLVTEEIDMQECANLVIPARLLQHILIMLALDETTPRGGIKKTYAINTAERPDRPSMN